MKKICRNLLLITILLSGTQVIDLSFTNFTFFQISFMIFACFFIIYIVIGKKLKRGLYLFLSMLFFISSFLAYFTSINKSWATSYLLLNLMISIIIIAVPNLFYNDDIVLLKKMLIRSQYIVIPFSIYSIYMFYFRGGLPNIVKLPLGMIIQLDNDFLLRSQASHQIRLSLPYATPPVLSLVLALCIIILLFSDNIYNKKIKYILIAIFSVLLVLTGSRTGIVGLFVAGFIFAFKNLKHKTIKTKKISFFALALIIITIVFFLIFDTVYIQKALTRFLNINILSDRHFLVPLDGLIIWTSSLKNFIFGIGFGSSAYMTGAHTYLPPYFLNSFVTLLVERGLLGLLIVIILIYLLMKKNIEYKKNYKESQLSLYILICTYAAAFIYEVFNCYFVIFIISMVLIDNNKGKEN